MRFLSVAERELRAGARRKATYHLRWITGAAFFVLLVWIMWAFDNFRTPEIFQIFATVAFFYCLLIGTARTADCLSSEKREGTMGLLFLTNLNAPEIISGKLCSSALAAAYGLFAIFPLLALQMLIGGITLGHFWRTVLALVNAILFAVSTGFLASSVYVRQFTAIAAASGVALFFSAGLMYLGALARVFPGPPGSKIWIEGLVLFSPAYSLVAAEGRRVFGPNHYWWSLLAVTGFSMTSLALATWQVSRSWRDRPEERRAWTNFKILQRWRQRRDAGRATLRRRLLGINPFFWLGGRHRVSAPVFMLLTIIVVAITSGVAAPYFGRVMPGGWFSPMLGHLFSWFWATLLIHALVLYYAAMASSRRLAEDKNSGALELVLSTPTSERSILGGLWMAYARKMFFPALVAILVHLFFIWQGATMAVLDGSSLRLPPGTTPGELLWHVALDQPIGGVRIQWGFGLALRIALLVLVLLILVWLTLGFVGRWLGLRLKHPGFAPMISLALLIVPPVLLFSLVCYVLVDVLNLDRLPQRKFLPALVWAAFGIGVGHCVLLSLWAGRRLRKSFRAVVTSRFQPPPLRPWWRPTRRAVVRFGIGSVATAAALAMIILSFYGYQNWRSRHSWSSFQKELRQRNESLNVAALLPGPVLESQNFALTSEFRNWVARTGSGATTNSLFSHLKQLGAFSSPPGSSITGLEWTEQGFSPLDEYLKWIAPGATVRSEATWEELARAALHGLKRHDETLRSLADRARLPYFQTSTNRSARDLLHPARKENEALERLHMLFQLRACALLGDSRNAEAAEDLLTGLQLVRLARQIPDAAATARTQILLARSLQPLWEGLVEQSWTEANLAAFQKELSQFNLLADHTNAVRCVVLAYIEIWRAIPKGQGALVEGVGGSDIPLQQMQPSAWWLDNCLQLYHAGETAVKAVNVAGAHVFPSQPWGDLGGLPLDDDTRWLLQQSYWPNGTPRAVAFAQTAVNQAIIACALERFRLAEGNYPEALDKLVPKYLSAIPKDVVRGWAMSYEKTGDGRFILRSVGPNQTDDRKNPGSDDWLWSFPTNAPPAAVR